MLVTEIARQQLAEAQMAYINFHRYKATRPQQVLTQELLDVLQAMLDYFGQVAPTIADQPSPRDADARASAVRSDIDVFLLRAEQGTKKLERTTGETGLLDHLDGMRHTLHGEIEALRMQARADF